MNLRDFGVPINGIDAGIGMHVLLESATLAVPEYYDVADDLPDSDILNDEDDLWGVLEAL